MKNLLIAISIIGMMSCAPSTEVENKAEVPSVVEETLAAAKEAPEEAPLPLDSQALSSLAAEAEKSAPVKSTTETPPPPKATIATDKKYVTLTAKKPAPSTEKAPQNVAESSQPSPAIISEETQKTEVEQEKMTDQLTVTQPDHGTFDQLLSTYVSKSGVVNYSGLKGQEAALDAYLAELGKATPNGEWNRNEAMAYWINAYNAFTIKLILQNWPVKSIMDLHGGKAWDVKWIKLAGKTYSLNQIEHDILRPQYKDARIHFAVNCAAQSCPPIHNRAFTAANLSSTLAKLTSTFINNPKYNTITDSSVQVSKIFDWYGGDFGDLKTYLNQYAQTNIGGSTAIGFQEYNWALNGK